jgi:epoxyqueuosine reductase QueG
MGRRREIQMAFEKLAIKIREHLLEKGTGKVGFADIRGVSQELEKKWSVAVSIAYPLDREVLKEIYEGPTKNYRDEYVRVNKVLAILGQNVCDLIQKTGYETHLVGPTTESWNKRTLSAEFPHKTAATRSGLGWIGKCALLVTREYGSAVRLCTIMTDAPLPVGKPVEQSFCGSCNQCRNVCPVSAPYGKEWSPSLSREDIIDIRACHDQAKAFSNARDLGHTICGICMVACPWTRAYINSDHV